jgi:hypothetical protein
MHALELVCGPWNLFRVYSSWNISHGLCIYIFEHVCGQLNLPRVCSSWNIGHGLCVYIFELECGHRTSLGSVALGRTYVAYVCMHLSSYVACGTSLGFAIFRTSSMAYVCMHLS